MTEVYKFQPPLTAATVEEILQDNYPKVGDPRYIQAEKDKLAALPTATQLSDSLFTKVDKEAGKGLSDTNYTQAEKDKLAGLEGSHYRGQFTSLAALEAAVTTPEPGDYADVDAGTGSTVVRYVWDSNDSVWTAQVGESTQLTGAQIKVMYEAQPDTNAFSDTDKSKLDGLGTAATANVTTSRTDTTAGRVFKVGDLGNGVDLIVTDTDCNSGSYIIPGLSCISASASTLTNAPPDYLTAGRYIVKVTGTLGSGIHQVFVNRNTGKEWKRYGSVSFSPWIEVWDSNNLVKTTSPTDTTAGRMLKVGDAGLIVSASLQTLFSGDANNVNINCTLWAAATWTGSPFVGTDSRNQGYVKTTIWSSATYAEQEFFNVGGANWVKLTRRMDNGVWSDWVPDYTARNILGTVSQSAGVPTGAIIQRGSNANGEFVRFADGTLICIRSVSVVTSVTLSAGGSFRSSLLTAPLPSNAVSGFNGRTIVSGGDLGNNVWLLGDATSSVSEFAYRAMSVASISSTTVQGNLYFIGRWY